MYYSTLSCFILSLWNSKHPSLLLQVFSLLNSNTGFIEITWVFALLIFCLCYGFGRILYNNDVTCKWQETTQPTRLPALGLQCYLHNNTALLIYFDYWISFNKFCLLKLLVANKPSTAEQILMCIFRNSFS